MYSKPLRSARQHAQLSFHREKHHCTHRPVACPSSTLELPLGTHTTMNYLCSRNTWKLHSKAGLAVPSLLPPYSKSHSPTGWMGQARTREAANQITCPRSHHGSAAGRVSRNGDRRGDDLLLQESSGSAPQQPERGRDTELDPQGRGSCHTAGVQSCIPGASRKRHLLQLREQTASINSRH